MSALASVSTATSATDCIEVNAGGRLYATTKTTLTTSGSGFFQALLGSTGTKLAAKKKNRKKKAKKSNRRTTRSSKVAEEDDDEDDDKDDEDDDDDTDNNNNNNNIAHHPLFVDCDPDLFSDVLYYMRRNRLKAGTAADEDKLEDLSAEADFFAFPALQSACGKALRELHTRTATTTATTTTAHSEFVNLDGINDSDKYHIIDIPKGQILYIVSATMELYPSFLNGEFEHSIWTEFRLVVTTDDGDGVHDSDQERSVASISFGEAFGDQAMTKIHGTGRKEWLPLVMDNHKDIRMCISRPERGKINLAADGQCKWDVLYWVGAPESIPGLAAMALSHHNHPAPPSKKRKGR